MANAKSGDLIEFQTNKGLAYALYTHKHPEFGCLIRVLDGFFETRPIEWEAVANLPVRFSTFFPLISVVRRKKVSVVGHVEVPKSLSAFPMFRAGVYDPASKTVRQWWLWDGDKEWKVPGLTPDELQYPLRRVGNLASVVDKLESGWIEAGALF